MSTFCIILNIIFLTLTCQILMKILIILWEDNYFMSKFLTLLEKRFFFVYWIWMASNTCRFHCFFIVWLVSLPLLTSLFLSRKVFCKHFTNFYLSQFSFAPIECLAKQQVCGFSFYAWVFLILSTNSKIPILSRSSSLLCEHDLLCVLDADQSPWKVEVVESCFSVASEPDQFVSWSGGTLDSTDFARDQDFRSFEF